jgi:hypothetical protein
MQPEQTPTNHKNLNIYPDFAKKMEIARRGIKKYRNALIDLAKSPNCSGDLYPMISISDDSLN